MLTAALSLQLLLATPAGSPDLAMAERGQAVTDSRTTAVARTRPRVEQMLAEYLTAGVGTLVFEAPPVLGFTGVGLLVGRLASWGPSTADIIAAGLFGLSVGQLVAAVTGPMGGALALSWYGEEKGVPQASILKLFLFGAAMNVPFAAGGILLFPVTLGLASAFAGVVSTFLTPAVQILASELLAERTAVVTRPRKDGLIVAFAF